MDEHLNITSLVLVMFLAVAVPPLLRRIKVVRIPIAVGEILAGVAVGRSGLNLLQPDAALQILQSLGLLYLMFGAGLEVDLQALARRSETGQLGQQTGLRARLHHPLVLGVALHAVTVTLAYAWASRYTDPSLVPHPLAFALLMSTVGFSIIMPVLKETQRLGTPFGQILVGIAAVGDFVPVVAMTVLITLHRQGSAVDLILLGVLFVVAYLAYRLARRFDDLSVFEGLSQGPAQIDVRGASLLMLAFGLLAQLLRVEVLLGAFLAGLLVTALVGEGRETLVHKMDAVGFGFLIPIFFVMVGVNFDVQVLWRNPAALAFVPLLLAVLVVIKAAPALILRLWHPWRLTLAGAALLTAQMSVTVAFSAVLLDQGMLGEPVHAGVVLTAILTAILGPVVYTRLLPDDPQAPQRSGVIIVGAGKESILLGRRLKATGEPYTLLDIDEAKVRTAERAGVNAVAGDALDAGTLRRVGAGTARAVVALTGSDAVNLAACRLAAEAFSVPHTVAVVRSSTGEERWPGLELINPGLATAALVEMMLVSPGTARLVAGDGEEQRLIDVTLRNRRCAGRRVRHAKLPPGILIVSVLRGGERIVPHGDTVLQEGDVLTLAGPPEDLAFARAFLSRD